MFCVRVCVLVLVCASAWARLPSCLCLQMCAGVSESSVEVQVPHLLEFFRFCSGVERLELEQVFSPSLSRA